MEALRTQDKIFVAVVLPLALAAAYVFLYRTDLSRRLAAEADECARLVAPEDFPMMRGRAERQLQAARDACAAEERIPLPPAQVRADPSESEATRAYAVLRIFRAHALTVTSDEAAQPEQARGAAILKATGVRPSPVCRHYVLTGNYADLLAALRELADRRMAVIPERIQMPTPGHWSLGLWL